MAVAPLNRRWLYMEQTAYSTSERLSNLTSREGDSFLDELCTMSGNVQQVVEALEFCIQVRGGEGWDAGEMQVGVGGEGHPCYSVVCMSNCCRLCNDDACPTAHRVGMLDPSCQCRVLFPIPPSLQSIHQGPIKESSLLRCSIVSLHEVHRVYMAMQKLLTTFQLETMPLCINFLLKEDKHFTDKMNAILGVTLETQPDLTVREVMSKLLEELRNSALKVW